MVLDQPLNIHFCCSCLNMLCARMYCLFLFLCSVDICSGVACSSPPNVQCFKPSGSCNSSAGYPVCSYKVNMYWNCITSTGNGKCNINGTCGMLSQWCRPASCVLCRFKLFLLLSWFLYVCMYGLFCIYFCLCLVDLCDGFVCASPPNTQCYQSFACNSSSGSPLCYAQLPVNASCSFPGGTGKCDSKAKCGLLCLFHFESAVCSCCRYISM